MWCLFRAAVLLSVLCAMLRHARRAAAIEPLTALREELLEALDPKSSLVQVGLLIASASFRVLFLKLRNSFGLHLPLIQKHGGNLWHKQLQFPTLTALSATLKFPQRNPENSSALPSVAWVEVSAVMRSGWVESAASVQRHIYDCKI